MADGALKPLKVLMFGWEFPPHNSGGLGVACQGLTRALSHLGEIEITFVLPRQVPVDADYMKLAFAGVENIKLRQVDSLLQPYITSEIYAEQLHNVAGGHYGENLLAEVLRYGQLAGEIAREEEFDIIHAHDWLSFPAGMAAKKTSGKPLIVHVHATEKDRTGGQAGHPVVVDIERQGLTAADCVMTVSQYTKDQVVTEYDISPEKVEVVHNGIDVSENTSSQSTAEINQTQMLDGLDRLKLADQKLVLFLGRFTVQKGADTFVKAAQRVLEYAPNTLFLMVGAGDMERELIELAAKLRISDRVVFTGFLRGFNRKRVYQAADLFVMPSVSEPFGLVALESLVHETPIIISKQSGVAEVVDHALKVDFWDEDQLVNMMVSVLQNQSLHSTLKDNGYMEVFKNTWERAAKRCAEIYQQLTANHNSITIV